MYSTFVYILYVFYMYYTSTSCELLFIFSKRWKNPTFWFRLLFLLCFLFLCKFLLPNFCQIGYNDEIHNGVWIVVCSEWPWIIILGFLRIAALKNAHNMENIWELHHKLRASSHLQAFLPPPHGSTLEVQRAAGSQSHHIQMEGTVSVNQYLQWEAVYMVRGCCLLRV